MPGATQQATLESVTEWSPATRSLFLRLPADRPLVFSAGQFISLELATGKPAPLVRAYSIASSPAQPTLLEICIDRVPGGEGSEHLFGLTRGATLDFKGPFGTFTPAESSLSTEMVFAADGTGIAPVRAIVAEVLSDHPDASITVLHGARTEAELIYRADFEGWMRRHPAVRWEPVMAPGGRGAGDNRALERLVAARYVEADGNRSRAFWLCGVGPIVRRLRDSLRAAGYERRAVRYEQW